MNDSRIFIQIASYRDPELLPTIRCCIANARHPENLTFGICWQKDETESLAEFASDPRFRIIEVPWNKSRGVCWARSLTQKLWENEPFTLQLDSHHRFALNWDDELLSMFYAVNRPKAIITAYAGVYTLPDKWKPDEPPYKIQAVKFCDHNGVLMCVPSVISEYQTLLGPIPARFISGHFLFAPGQFCQECQYDPNLYFSGEEISLSARAFTMGYDLFHPQKTVIWHEYTRYGRTKHWDDFQAENKDSGVVDRQWWEMDRDSKTHLRRLLRGDGNAGEFGFGTARPLADYENYAGVDFKRLALTADARMGKTPCLIPKSGLVSNQTTTGKL
jgi:hypothetical protein